MFKGGWKFYELEIELIVIWILKIIWFLLIFIYVFDLFIIILFWGMKIKY